MATSSVKASSRSSVSSGCGVPVARERDDRAPQPPLDDDRAAHRGPDCRAPWPRRARHRRRCRSWRPGPARRSAAPAPPQCPPRLASAIPPGGRGPECRVCARSRPRSRCRPARTGPRRWFPRRGAWPVSAATAPNTSGGETPRATSVATRRRAACSSATRPSSSRLVSSESAMLLNDRSRRPTSPGPVSGIRTVRSPPATWPAIPDARRTGWTTDRVR